ncbi:MAG: tRNA epoxyqueuosine(34) reductase QueG [Planctomycetota bacterium]
MTSPRHETPRPSPEELAEFFKRQARSLGFDLVGLAPATLGLGFDRLSDWLAAGKQGEMNYMATQAPARNDPRMVLAGVRSLLVVGLSYQTEPPSDSGGGEGRVARYAWGRDYHDVIREKLKTLAREASRLDPQLSVRPVVDSAPVMERDYAVLAGLGWIGKNTLLLHRRLGSWFFLGALLVDRELPPDIPFETNHCGSCTRCLDACPTDAFDGPYQLDPRRCISYLSIEHRSGIPESLRAGMGEWLFGCDVCQEVCPWNRKAPPSSTPDFQPREGMNPLSLISLLSVTDQEFRQRFRGTPLFRTGRSRMVRNAVIVAANQGRTDLLPAIRSLAGDADMVVREAANWAIDQLEKRA